MRLEEVAGLVEGVLHMSVAQARQIYDHFGIYRPASVLELGFAHGVSTCYLAGALQEVGGESVTTIDIVSALNVNPTYTRSWGDADWSILSMSGPTPPHTPGS